MALHNLIRLTVTAAAVALVCSLPIPCTGDTPAITEDDWAAVPEIELYVVKEFGLAQDQL